MQMHTEIMRQVARAPAALPNIFIGRAVRVWRMLVSDLAEEVDAIPAREERRRDRVDGCIAPTLSLVHDPKQDGF